MRVGLRSRKRTYIHHRFGSFLQLLRHTAFWSESADRISQLTVAFGAKPRDPRVDLTPSIVIVEHAGIELGPSERLVRIPVDDCAERAHLYDSSAGRASGAGKAQQKSPHARISRVLPSRRLEWRASRNKDANAYVIVITI
jgi:hypothetical protein